MALDGLVGVYFLPFDYKSSAPRKRRGGKVPKGTPRKRQGPRSGQKARSAKKRAKREKPPGAGRVKRPAEGGPRPRRRSGATEPRRRRGARGGGTRRPPAGATGDAEGGGAERARPPKRAERSAATPKPRWGRAEGRRSGAGGRPRSEAQQPGGRSDEHREGGGRGLARPGAGATPTGGGNQQHQNRQHDFVPKIGHRYCFLV